MWVDLRSLWESSGSPDVTVALTGVSGTGAVGSVAVAFTLAFSGVGGTGSVGSVAPSFDASLSGNAGTGSVGSVAITSSLALVGAGGSGSVGTVAPLSGVPLAGSTATGSVGTVALSFDIALTGNAGTSAVGSVSIAGDITTALSGVVTTGSVGSVSVAQASQDGGKEKRKYELPKKKYELKPKVLREAFEIRREEEFLATFQERLDELAGIVDAPAKTRHERVVQKAAEIKLLSNVNALAKSYSVELPSVTAAQELITLRMADLEDEEALAIILIAASL